MDIFGIQPAIKPSVTVVLENGKIHIAGDTRIGGSVHQLFIMLFHLFPKQQTFFIFLQLLESLIISQLLTAGLQGKVGLTIGDHWLGRVAVLNHQITGVAGQAHVGQFAFGAGADRDHFVDLHEMV